MEQQVTQEELNAAWVDNHLAAQRVEATTGQQLVAVERHIAQLRESLSNAEGHRQELQSAYTQGMSGPKVQLKALALLAEKHKLGLPATPATAVCGCGQPIGRGLAGWEHLVSRAVECQPGDALSQKATPAHEGDQRVAGSDRPASDRGAK